MGFGIWLSNTTEKFEISLKNAKSNLKQKNAKSNFKQKNAMREYNGGSPCGKKLSREASV